jgi:hypothetical protein
MNFYQPNELLLDLFYSGYRMLQQPTVLSHPFLRTLRIGLFILANYSCQNFDRVRDSNPLMSEYFQRQHFLVPERFRCEHFLMPENLWCHQSSNVTLPLVKLRRC